MTLNSMNAARRPRALAPVAASLLIGVVTWGALADGALAQSTNAATATATAATTAATTDAKPVRLRGAVESYAPPKLTIRERSGELLTLSIAPNQAVQEVVPIDIGAIAPGSFIGAASVAKADGRLEAVEVVVFPEAARGTGEGHYAWDLLPDSTMTNATVAGLVRQGGGRELTLRYKDGEKRIVVPEGVPIVTFKPGDSALMVPGAKVFVVAVLRDGAPTVTRLVVGRNGFAPPM